MNVQVLFVPLFYNRNNTIYIYIYLFADEKPKLPKNKMKMREKNVDPTAYTGVSIYSINEQEIVLL